MKKCIALLLAILMLPLCALAEENPLQKAFEAFEALMLETTNVTLTLKADFEYDGEAFKKVDAAYIQADSDSMIQPEKKAYEE